MVKRKLSRPGQYGMYVILVVEDKPEEAEKGVGAVKEKKCIAASASPTLGAVSNIDEFRQHLENTEVVWDGVITDLYLTHEPLGLEVAFECKKRNIPCVICTDKYSHADSQWWYKIAKELGAELEVRKNWEAAVGMLIDLIENQQKGGTMHNYYLIHPNGEATLLWASSDREAHHKATAIKRAKVIDFERTEIGDLGIFRLCKEIEEIK